ncbi:MAG: hypothetical protein SGPRY_005324, partial [Prymnesium sp.]
MADPHVIARSAPPSEPAGIAQYVQAHMLERGLNDALNILARKPGPDPWKLLVEALPADVRIPAAPTVPDTHTASVLRSEFQRDCD